MKVEIRAERLREEIARSGRKSRQPYEAGLKRKLVEYAQQRKREGASYVAIGEELGIVWPTIAEWIGREPKKRLRAGFQRVEVREVAQAPSAALVVVHTSGTRVEGLDVAGVADLLRRLA